MSARLRLALSYLAFLVIAAALFAVLLYYALHFVPADTDGSVGPSRGDLVNAVVPRAAQVMAVLVVLALVGGWLLAGRMLRPLHRINDVARRVAAGSFDRRVELAGPPDEFRELADTFDAMLDRLQAALDEQRRFAANASHELRTPSAVARSMLDVALADPEGQDLREVVRRLDEMHRRSAEVIEALLALSSLDHVTELATAPVDVAETAAGAVAEVRPLAEAAGVRLEARLGEGDVEGSAVLVRQLLSNLLLNGVRHNVASGWLSVETATDADDRVVVTVSNTGPVVGPELLATMTEPFVRGGGRVAATDGPAVPRGAGLGLAIVARIAQVHGAELLLDAPPTGGLDVRVRFRPA